MFWNKFRYIIIVLVVCSGFGQTVAYAAPLSDLDNQHNLSSSATHGGPQALPEGSGGTDRICIFCHTPHSATPESPLWSRPDPSGTTFQLYALPLAIKGDLGAPAGAVSRSQYNATTYTYPNGASRLCLSCHDGTTAIGILQDGTSIAMAGAQNTVTGTAIIDLSTSHPISFVYNSPVLADVIAVRGAGTYQLPPNGASDPPAPLDGKERMQCTTCHDPHDDTRVSLGLPFWRHDKTPTVGAYEDVCNQCHVGANPSFTNPSPGGTDHTSPDLL